MSGAPREDLGEEHSQHCCWEAQALRSACLPGAEENTRVSHTECGGNGLVGLYKLGYF